MTVNVTDPVLLLGGTGTVGTPTAKLLRSLYPDLPLAIGARNQEKCEALAQEIGGAIVVKPDLMRDDLGLGDRKFSAVAALLKENTLNPMRFAQAREIPYINMADGSHEIGPGVARLLHSPNRIPILMGGHWLVGVGVLLTLCFTREFKSVDSLAMTVIPDADEKAGPMAEEDIAEVMHVLPRPQMLVDGKWQWVGEEQRVRKIRTATGEEIDVSAISLLDTLSLAAATDARSVRFDIGIAQTASSARGEPYSHEIIVEIKGVKKDGSPAEMRIDFDAPLACAGTTALGVSLAVERMLGLDGNKPPAPGLYFPDTLIDPSYAMARFKDTGGKYSVST